MRKDINLKGVVIVFRDQYGIKRSAVTKLENAELLDSFVDPPKILGAVWHTDSKTWGDDDETCFHCGGSMPIDESDFEITGAVKKSRAKKA